MAPTKTPKTTEQGSTKRGGKRAGAGRPVTTGAVAARAARKGNARGRVPQLADAVNIVVRVPAKLRDDAQNLATLEQRTLSDVVRDALERYLNKE